MRLPPSWSSDAPIEIQHNNSGLEALFDASEDTMHPLRLRSTRNSVDAKEGSQMFL